MRIDRRLQRAGEDLACGVADHDPLPHLINRDVGEVHGAEAHAPLLPGQLPISLGQPGPLRPLLLPRPAGGTALEAVPDVQAHRLMISRQVAAEPVGQRGRVVRERGHDDRELARLSGEPGLLIMQDG